MNLIYVTKLSPTVNSDTLKQNASCWLLVEAQLDESEKELVLYRHLLGYSR